MFYACMQGVIGGLIRHSLHFPLFSPCRIVLMPCGLSCFMHAGCHWWLDGCTSGQAQQPHCAVEGCTRAQDTASEVRAYICVAGLACLHGHSGFCISYSCCCTSASLTALTATFRELGKQNNNKRVYCRPLFPCFLAGSIVRLCSSTL